MRGYHGIKHRGHADREYERRAMHYAVELTLAPAARLAASCAARMAVVLMKLGCGLGLLVPVSSTGGKKEHFGRLLDMDIISRLSAQYGKRFITVLASFALAPYENEDVMISIASSIQTKHAYKTLQATFPESLLNIWLLANAFLAAGYRSL